MLIFATLAPLFFSLALVLDAIFGELRRFHPLVGFGLFAAFLERCLNKPIKSRLLGVLALFLALFPVLLVALALFYLFLMSPFLWAIMQVFVLYFCIGLNSLFSHVSAVERALLAQDIPLAREKLSLIVSRNTEQLNADEIAQAALESLLENSSDALFCSLFWFALGGGALALLHRFSNTLDAMWGYKTARFYYFGWAAARLDDALAWMPARLTALSFVLVGEHKKNAWRAFRTQAKACASPNGGPVMCAGAGALGVRLSLGAYYQGVWQAKPPMGYGALAGVADIKKGKSLVKKALFLWLLASFVLGFLVQFYA